MLLNSHLLKNDTLGVGGTTEGRGLEGGTESALLVLLVRPSVVATVSAQLSCGRET